MRNFYLLFKTFSDKLLAILLLIFFTPIFLIISLILYFSIGKPIIFKQKRPGLNCKPFYIYKFRTMKNTRDKNGKLLPDIMRKTKVGNFLRSYSFDELLELINIIKGEMSFIGPRPLLMDYLPLYNKEQMQRHNLKPGITGLAQVSGRNLISWEKKFELDNFYIKNVNLCLDIMIFLKTFINFLKKEGINSKGDLPVDKFRGNL